jgi:hypothetical protein
LPRLAGRAALARSSLCLLAVFMVMSSCLVTSPPSFDPPQQTAPFLIAASAEPDPRKVIVIDSSKSRKVDFSVEVRSQDNGEPVLFQLYVDYGYPAETEDPDELLFKQVITTLPSLPGGTLDGVTRTVHPTWHVNELSAGCHIVTLIASHAFFPNTACPMCLQDSSQITWQVFACNSAKGDDCAPTFTEQCRNWPRSCPLVADPETDKCGASP